MTEQHQPDMTDVLAKLAKMMEKSDTIEVLSQDEVAMLREMQRGYAMLLSWGKLGRLLIWLVLTAAAVKAGMDLLAHSGPTP